MGKGGRLSRGDRRRNARLERFREVIRPDVAITAVDLAKSSQAVVVMDHDSRVLGRRRVSGTPWTLDSTLDWADSLAATAARPLDTLSWQACLSVSVHPTEIAAMTWRRFHSAATRHLPDWGGTRLHHPTTRKIWESARTPGGIPRERDAATERLHIAYGDWHRTLTELAHIEPRMVDTLHTVGLYEIAESIPGVSPLAVAAILAETGDPDRYDTARTWVKHAGWVPRANHSGQQRGTTTVSKRGRPRLRTASWQAAFTALRHNPATGPATTTSPPAPTTGSTRAKPTPPSPPPYSANSTPSAPDASPGTPPPPLA